MNMQSLMKQAQNLQKDMMKTKKEIDQSEFVGESSLIKVTIKGTKEVIRVEIKKDADIDMEDLELLEDMFLLAMNEATKKVDEFTEEKMGKFGNAMPTGLF